MADENYYILLLIVTAVLTKTTGAQGVTPVDVTVFQGQQVTFNCSGSQVSWFHVESPSVTKKLFTSPDKWHPEKGTKYDIIGNYYLVIKDAQASSDGGTYQCDTNDNNNQLLNSDLVILDEIYLNVNPSGHLERGMTITITCAIRYGGPTFIEPTQDPTLTLTLDNTADLPTGNIYYQAPTDTDNYHRKTLIVNYTLSDATPGRHLRCTVRSLNYEEEVKEMLQIAFAPRISKIEEREYNTSDSITCTAEGIPEPTVTWKLISGSMPASNTGMSGKRQAVLKNLQDGTHTWMCTATNNLGSDNYTVTFTVSGVNLDEGKAGEDDNRVGLWIGIAIGILVIIAVIVIVIVCIVRRYRKMNKGGTPNQPTDPNKPPINNDHRPPRPRSDVGNEPNVNPNPNPTYEPPVYPEQYSNSPAKTSMDRPGYGDLGVRPIHAGGSTPSLNRSYEGTQRESGASDQFQGPNTSV